MQINVVKSAFTLSSNYFVKHSGHVRFYFFQLDSSPQYKSLRCVNDSTRARGRIRGGGCYSPMLEFLLLRGLAQVTPLKKIFSWEYSRVTSLPLKIWTTRDNEGLIQCDTALPPPTMHHCIKLLFHLITFTVGVTGHSDPKKKKMDPAICGGGSVNGTALFCDVLLCS